MNLPVQYILIGQPHSIQTLHDKPVLSRLVLRWTAVFITAVWRLWARGCHSVLRKAVVGPNVGWWKLANGSSRPWPASRGSHPISIL